MLSHRPNCLRGPVSRTRPWWASSARSQAGAEGTAVKSSARGRGVTKMDKHADESQGQDGEIRWELVEQVRREIAAGTYESPEKWQAALDKLLSRMEEEK